MKRLKILILAFCLALSVPLAYFVFLTFHSLQQEERAELTYFAETLFDEMERELSEFVIREEQRAVDEYNTYYSGKNPSDASVTQTRSPLSRLPDSPFLLGYFQNNPDGTFHTPLKGSDPVSARQQAVVDRLQTINTIFNQKRTSLDKNEELRPQPKKKIAPKAPPKTFADNYLSIERFKKSRSRLGYEEKQVRRISPEQAQNLARNERDITREKENTFKEEARSQSFSLWESRRSKAPSADVSGMATGELDEGFAFERQDENISSLQLEMDPMQAVFIDDNHIFLFRRIIILNRIYRQGVVLIGEAFLEYLVEKYFSSQPLARFTRIQMTVMENGRMLEKIETGAKVTETAFSLKRTFTRPFSFLNAKLMCENIPASSGRNTLTLMLVALGGIILIGMIAIYQSARTVMDLSERRSRFVSSVTHELKTPLTNIRMYIEMLELGIARNQEREEEYYRILDSESARLSRLINNVLEFSKLEKKQIRLHLQKGDFSDVIEEVRQIMNPKLKQEGFELQVDIAVSKPFDYDREMMIQALINLIENSMKFGREADEKKIVITVTQKKDRVQIAVSDRGPGIPSRELKKVFDDFYRVDNSITQNTRGTGIGLSLIKKFVHLANGNVRAENNVGPGCSVTIELPVTQNKNDEIDQESTVYSKDKPL